MPTPVDPAAIAQARAAGYSDQEIADHLSQAVPEVKQARDAGYDDTAIVAHLGSGAAAPAEQDPFMGIAPITTRDPKKMEQNLSALAAKRASPDVIREYVRQSGGYDMPAEFNDWLDKQYGPALEKNPHAKPNLRFTVEDRPGVGTLGSVWAGFRSGATAGFDDELAAISRASQAWSAGAPGSFGDLYDQALKEERAHKDDAYQNRGAYGVGFVPGMLVSSLYGGSEAEGAGLAARVAAAAKTGAAYGGASGAGNAEGGLADRLISGLWGAGAGALLGPAALPLGAVAANIGRRVANNLMLRGNALNSGLDVLVDRVPQSGDEMRTRAAEFRAAGVEPRPVDVVNMSGKRVIRSATNKVTPANEEVAQHAADVYTNMQGRVAAQARRISNQPLTARQMATQIAEERAALDSPEFRAAAPSPVPITDPIKQVLETGEGQAALRGATKYLSADDREAANRLLAAARRAAKGGPVDPDAGYAKVIPGWDKMPEAARAQVRAQMPDLAAKDPWEGATLNVDLADKLARVLMKNDSTPGLARVSREFGNTIRDEARTASAPYAKVLDAYAARAGVQDAAQGTGNKFAASDFLSSHPEDFSRAAADASTTPAALRDTVSEADALRARARDTVIEEATKNAGQYAGSVARQLSRGEAQAARNRALLGANEAGALERGMGREVERLDNTRFIDPRIGSETHSKSQDAIVDGFAGALTHLSTKAAMIRAAHMWLKAGGIRGIDAERLARDAIDPARTDAAIDYLEQRGMARARADRFIRHYAAALGGRVAGAYVSTETPPPPVGSIRALTRTHP